MHRELILCSVIVNVFSLVVIGDQCINGDQCIILSYSKSNYFQTTIDYACAKRMIPKSWPTMAGAGVTNKCPAVALVTYLLTDRVKTTQQKFPGDILFVSKMTE